MTTATAAAKGSGRTPSSSGVRGDIEVLKVAGPSENLSRQRLLLWANEVLQAHFSAIEQLCGGDAFCLLTKILFPDSINLSKVKWNSRREVDWRDNWKLVEAGWTKRGIRKAIPVERLVKGKFLENYEFLQWFRKLFDSAYEGQSFNPVAMRRGIELPGEMKTKLSRMGSSTGSRSSVTGRPSQHNTPSPTFVKFVDKSQAGGVKDQVAKEPEPSAASVLQVPQSLKSVRPPRVPSVAPSPLMRKVSMSAKVLSHTKSVPASPALPTAAHVSVSSASSVKKEVVKMTPVRRTSTMRVVGPNSADKVQLAKRTPALVQRLSSDRWRLHPASPQVPRLHPASPSIARFPSMRRPVVPPRVDEQQVQQLQNGISQMEKEVGYLVKERNFYYLKCRDVEDLCKQMMRDGDSVSLAKGVMKILVKSEEGFEVPPEGVVYAEVDYVKSAPVPVDATQQVETPVPVVDAPPQDGGGDVPQSTDMPPQSSTTTCTATTYTAAF